MACTDELPGHIQRHCEEALFADEAISSLMYPRPARLPHTDMDAGLLHAGMTDWRVVTDSCP